MIIRAFQKSDYSQWLPLWNANGMNQVPQTVTNQTWGRLCDPGSAVGGFGAFADEGDLAGFVHYILHPTTGHLHPVCYMQDVFVAQNQRRKGIARALVNRLALEGREQGWPRIYWFAEKTNDAAQNLYKTLGIRMDFTLHILPVD